MAFKIMDRSHTKYLTVSDIAEFIGMRDSNANEQDILNLIKSLTGQNRFHYKHFEDFVLTEHQDLQRTISTRRMSEIRLSTKTNNLLSQLFETEISYMKRYEVYKSRVVELSTNWVEK